jgi:hypothetical protein
MGNLLFCIVEFRGRIWHLNKAIGPKFSRVALRGRMILSPVQRALIYISGANLIVGSPTMSPRSFLIIFLTLCAMITWYGRFMRAWHIGTTLEEFVSALARHIYLYIYIYRPGPCHGRVALFFHCIRTKSEIKKLLVTKNDTLANIYILYSRVAHFLLFCQKKYSDYSTARYNVFVCCSRSVRKILLVYPDVP